MIKRRFYKQDRGDNSGTSESSSSDESDSFPEVDAEEDHEVEEEEDDQKGERGGGNDKNTPRHPSPGSGYESEDSSNNQDDDDDDDTSDLLTNEEDASGENTKDGRTVGKVPHNEVEMNHKMIGIKMDPNHPIQTDISNFILKFKSVFKCKLCPRILCLNEDTVRTHLSSKRHARYAKLHDEGRLKLMLNSDGELEEEQETHAERHARILALSQKPNPSEKKDIGRRKKKKGRKKRVRGASCTGKSEPSIKKCSNKKRRTVDN